MAKYIVIRCEVPFAVSVDDLSVHLRGRGSEQTVLEDSASSSPDLRDKVARRWVSLHNTGVAARRMWPTAKPVVLPSFSPLFSPLPPDPVSEPAPAPPSPDPELLRVLRGIEDKLGALLTRPSPPPAEVVAAHVRAIGALTSVPEGLPGAPHPQFIPSTILPEGADAGKTIKVKQEESKVDVGDSVSALKHLRKKT